MGDVDEKVQRAKKPTPTLEVVLAALAMKWRIHANSARKAGDKHTAVVFEVLSDDLDELAREYFR